MREPVARPTRPATEAGADVRVPRAFAPAKVATEAETVFDPPETLPDTLPPPRGPGLFTRLAWGAGGILVSLGLALAAERLIRDLFARYEWLGWAGIAVLAVFVLALLVLAAREVLALWRLRHLDGLRRDAALVLVSDDPHQGRKVIDALEALYSPRPDLARARKALDDNKSALFDGTAMIHFAERTLMAPLDARARALTAASARRVALVTAVSPRALVDIAFVAYESIRLAGAIAALYGARPGFFGFWRLTGSVLGHLAVTGGLALTDGVIEQLVGQGLASKLSARLGEGVVNGLMTVRVGIAAMRVTRPLPFDAIPQPMVRDFAGDLANLGKSRE